MLLGILLQNIRKISSFNFFQDNIGVFVDQNGKLLQEGMICWSEAPAAVAVEKPYAVGLLPRHVEVSLL